LRTLATASLHDAAPTSLRRLYRICRDRGALPWPLPKGTPGDLRDLLNRETRREFEASRMAKRRQAGRQGALDDDQHMHARTFTSGMLSFAHEVNAQNALSRGVEPRSPFSDRRLIEFAIQMPLEAKLAAPSYKHLLRLCMRGILPEGIR